MNAVRLTLMAITVSLCSNWNVVATLYTRCNSTNPSLNSTVPIFTSNCKTLLQAAALCSHNYFCDFILRNDTTCSFYTAENRNTACPKEETGHVSLIAFRLFTLFTEPDVWIRVGPLYLYVTPEAHTCSQGQDICTSLGGNMAEFYSREEVDNALTFVTGDVFVGVELLFDGRHVWKTTGQEIDPSLWYPGEPQGGFCVYLWYSTNDLDDTSSSTEKPVLCEKRIP